MSDYIWGTFDALFKTIRAQALRIQEMETRITELERNQRRHESELSRLKPAEEQAAGR
jgi:hypothetical protein